jgi:hypothetical protein
MRCNVIVVPAQAGIHTQYPKPNGMQDNIGDSAWVPASAGTTVMRAPG